MPTALETLKPGQNIQVTVTKAPRTEDAVGTIERLMRQDPNVKRGLRKTHRRRMQNLNVYIRGNRDWTSREKCSKLVRVEQGATWTMTYVPHLAPDMKSVERFLSVKPA